MKRITILSQGVLLGSLVSTGCGATIAPNRPADLRATARRAKAIEDYHACRVRMEAEIAARRRRCVQQTIAHQACRRGRTEGSVLACAGGALGALAFGATLPKAAATCGKMLGIFPRRQCKAACSLTQKQIERVVLVRAGMDFLPRCTGYVGVTTSVARATLRNGVYITQVGDRSPAALAGLRKLDIITHVNGRPVRTARALARRVASTAPDTRLTLIGYRNGILGFPRFHGQVQAAKSNVDLKWYS